MLHALCPMHSYTVSYLLPSKIWSVLMKRPQVGVAYLSNETGRRWWAKEKDLTVPERGPSLEGIWSLVSHSRHAAKERSLKRLD